MIEVQGVEKVYKKKLAVLKNVDFKIQDGEIVALLGHNGSGKSTLLKCMTGVIKPSNGKVLIDGIDSFRYQRKLLHKIGVVFNQKPSFIVDLTVMDNLQFFKAIYDVSDLNFDEMLATIDQYLKISSLYKKQYRKLSFGERVKCEIASVLLHNPKYLFLDEPTIGLDYNAKKGLYQLLQYINNTFGTTIMIITHEVDYIQQIFSHALIISEGEIKYDNNANDIVEAVKRQGYLLKVSYTDIKNVERLNMLMDRAEEKDVQQHLLRFRISDEKMKEDILKECVAAASLTEVKVENVTLREVLENVLKEKNSAC